MSLDVCVVRARDLLNLERFGASDPFVRLTFRGVQKKTTVIDDDLNPAWNETLTFDLENKALTSDEVLEVTVFDHEKIGRDKELGTATIWLQ